MGQHLLGGGQLLRTGRLGQLSRLDVRHFVHIEAGVPACQLVLGHHHGRVQGGQESLCSKETGSAG